MPTIPLRVQQNGTLQGWSALVGGSFGYQTIDDSDGTTHDSAASYLTLPRLNLGLGQGVVSFPMFYQAEGINPSSITINVVAQRGGATHPRLQIGFYRSGVMAFDATLFNPGASWGLFQATFNTNPITGQSWAPDGSDVPGLEVCVQSESGIVGNNDITLISGSCESLRPFYLVAPDPQGAITG